MDALPADLKETCAEKEARADGKKYRRYVRRPR